MKTIERENSTQVLGNGGRLIGTFPSQEQAKAFVSGYETGLRDSTERVERRTREMMSELLEMKG
jgi:viroplasmin and RNaseH domain-containing protein